MEVLLDLPLSTFFSSEKRRGERQEKDQNYWLAKTTFHIEHLKGDVENEFPWKQN